MEKRLLDPRKALALDYYSDPASETFSNARQSMLKAGYSEASAKDVQKLDWFNAHRATFHVNLIKKAERNLDRIASIQVKLDKASNKAEIEIAKLQADISKFVVDRLARAKYGKNEEIKPPEVTINIVSPKAPSATRDAEVIEPKEIDAQSATRDASSA